MNSRWRDVATSDQITDLEELERLFQEAEIEFNSMIDHIAWIVRTKALGCDLRQSANRPPSSVSARFDLPLFQMLALRDPLFFDLARHETADRLHELDMEDWPPDVTDFAVVLLRARPPERRRDGGDNLGRDVLLCVAATLLMEGAGPKPNPSRRSRRSSSTRSEPLTGPMRINLDALDLDTPRFGDAQRLADLIASHPTLIDFESVTPSAHVIRAVWKKRSTIFEGVATSSAKLDKLMRGRASRGSGD